MDKAERFSLGMILKSPCGLCLGATSTHLHMREGMLTNEDVGKRLVYKYEF
jgi:hypothetical protein